MARTVTYITTPEPSGGSGFGASWQFGTPDNLVYVLPGVSVYSGIGAGGIASLTDDNLFVVMGSVIGANFAGASLGFAAFDTFWVTGNSLTVAQGGTVVTFGSADVPGGTGVEVFGTGNRVTNHGTIIGEFVGIALHSNAAGSGTPIVNTGVIEGGTGIRMEGPEAVSIENSGTMRATLASGTAIDAAANTGAVSLRNTGEITGDVVLTGKGDVVSNHGTVFGDLDLGAGSDQFVNRGTVVGDLVLGSGNDVYDGRKGTIDGMVDGGTGGDLFYAGSGVDVFIGGDGTDTVSFSGADAVTVDLLKPEFNAGRATDDVYTGIENLSGSNASDQLVGDHGANQLRGRAGDDVLTGRGGIDILIGGTGKDRLSGGADGDIFRYMSTDEFGDVITDFSATTSNNDIFQFSLAGLGATPDLGRGLILKSQFRANTTGAAADANDHFIFRTTDTTLWYDPDGKGGAAAVMVANLQSDAVLTYEDFLIIA